MRHTTPASFKRLYADYVNPQRVRLLDLLGMNVRYERCLGAELHTSDGRHILDFLSGYCVKGGLKISHCGGAKVDH